MSIRIQGNTVIDDNRNAFLYSGQSTGELNVGRSSSQRFNLYVTDYIGYIRYYQDEGGSADHSVSFEIQSPSSGPNRFLFNKYVQASGSMRSPIFYDSNNTSYFANPASTSRFNQARFQNRISVGDGNGTPFLNTGSPGIWLSYNGGSTMFMGSENTSTWGTYIGDWRFRVNSSGTASATGDMRAPIFYDSNNTGYYVNPASNSVLESASVKGYSLRDTLSISVSAGNWYTIATNPGNRAYATFYIWDTRSGRHGSMSFNAGISYGSVATITMLGKSWYSGGGIFDNIRIRRSGTYDTHYLQIYIRTSGTINIAMTDNYQSSGWSLTNGGTGNPGSTTAAEVRPNSYRGLATNSDIYSGSNVYGASSVRAPIFYDQDNTGYYVNPASTTYLNNLVVEAGSSSWGDVQINGSSGWGSTAYPTIGSNGSGRSLIMLHNPHIPFRTDNERSGASGRAGIRCAIDTSASNYWDIGLYGDAFEIWRNSSSTQQFWVDASGNTFSRSSSRAPIFYDSNNTGYYTNPASTSILNTVRVADRVEHNTASTRYKYLLYGTGNSSYAIGMQSGITYGGLGDWAMTFQFNNDSNRGFWWGHDGHSTAQGAMSLTTAGHLFVGSRVDAPIFYDSNNTGYYTNPASTSRLNSVHANYLLVDGGGHTKLIIDGNGGSGYYQQLHIGESREGSAALHLVYRGDGYSWIGMGSADTRIPANWIMQMYYTSQNVTFNNNISAQGNVTAYSSDKRLKTNFRQIEGSLEKVTKLTGYYFDWKDDTEKLGFSPDNLNNEVGLIAQEVQEILPQATPIAPFDYDQRTNGSKSGENYLTVQYEKIVPLLVEAIKEQQEIIERMDEKYNECNEEIIGLKKIIEELQNVN